MIEIIKQSVGIDCGSEELVVSFYELNMLGESSCRSTRCFKNTKAGFDQLVRWSSKYRKSSVSCVFVVEATGVYHQKMAYFLFEKGESVSIVLPNKINAYAKSFTSKLQDDFQASRVIGEFGCVKKLDLWTPPAQIYHSLFQLTRELGQLKDDCTALTNQLHAEMKQAIVCEASLKRMNTRLKLNEKHQMEIENEISILIESDKELSSKMENITSIPGVGLITAATIVAETRGFDQIRNSRQLVSYAGYDVIQKISGTSVRGKVSISKKGNSRIRKALYFPAMSAVRFNPDLKEDYERIMEKQTIKMKGLVAIQRKLLVLVYTLWKKDEKFTSTIKCLEQPLEAALTELD